METFVAGRNLAIEVEFVDSQGGYITPSSASYSLTDENGLSIVTDLAITPTDFSHVIALDAANNMITETQGYRQLSVTYSDDKNITYSTEKAYILEKVNSLIMGENSFKSMGLLMIAATNLSGIEAVHESEIQEVKVALRQAYSNIARLSVSIQRDDQSIVTTAADLTAADLLGINPAYFKRLAEAQLIEANHLLGGNPMEQRRRSGILSESVGEVSQFFRTKKPLTMPVCREALEILGSLLSSSSKRIGRS